MIGAISRFILETVRRYGTGVCRLSHRETRRSSAVDIAAFAIAQTAKRHWLSFH